MWDILTKGGIGLVLLLDNTRPTPFEDMRFYIKSFKEFIDSTCLVIGVTQMDARAPPRRSTTTPASSPSFEVTAPIFEVDARQRGDVSVLIEALLLQIDPTSDLPSSRTDSPGGLSADARAHGSPHAHRRVPTCTRPRRALYYAASRPT